MILVLSVDFKNKANILIYKWCFHHHEALITIYLLKIKNAKNITTHLINSIFKKVFDCVENLNLV